MRRGECISVAAATASKRFASAATPVLRSGTAAAAPPTRVRLVKLQGSVSAAHACSVTLALHGAAIAHNLQCVLTMLDPEGPHQLRIALRRTRVALRVFEPVMRRKVNAQLVETARALGSIAGELRDADVMIDEIIAPAARDEAGLLAALMAWRQEVRGRVRARLLAAEAPATAADFLHAAATPTWLKADAPRSDVSFAGLIDRAERAYWEKAAPLGARLADLTHLELHQLRKAVKALRYSAELAASVGRDNAIVPRLKRIQEALGYVNDTAALDSFDPPVFGEANALAAVRARLVAKRDRAAADALATATRDWRAFAVERWGVRGN
jgi:CHAD domain-containing protein